MRASLVREVNTLTGDLLSSDTPVPVNGGQETLRGNGNKKKDGRGGIIEPLGIVPHILNYNHTYPKMEDRHHAPW